MQPWLLVLLFGGLLILVGCPKGDDDSTTDDDDGSGDDDSTGDDDDDVSGDDDSTGDDDDTTDDDTTGDDDATADPCAGIAMGNVVFGHIEIDPVVVDDDMGEWFELVNMTVADIDLVGFALYDDGSDYHLIASSLIVTAQGAVVLGINADPTTNGGVAVDYAYTDIALGNGGDELYLDCGGLLIDHLSW